MCSNYYKYACNSYDFKLSIDSFISVYSHWSMHVPTVLLKVIVLLEYLDHFLCNANLIHTHPAIMPDALRYLSC